MNVTDTAESSPPTKAGAREWAGLAILAMSCLLLALDMSVLFLAMPHLSADLGATGTQQLWIMDIYGFMIAGFLVTMGNLGDRLGHRRLLLIGAATFGLASIAAAYSVSPEMLIAARAALGIAGATQMPSLMALIRVLFTDSRQRGFAIAVFMSCLMGGTAIGPIVGGMLLAQFWWGSVFLMGVPVMALLLIGAPLLVPADPPREADAPGLDLISVVLSLAAILPVVYGLKTLAAYGLTPGGIAALIAGPALAVIFVWRQRRLATPLVDLRLLSNRRFSACLLLMLITGGVMGGMFFLFSQQIQLVAGYSVLESGLWLTGPSIAMIVTSLAAPLLARSLGQSGVLSAGLGLTTLGMVTLWWVDVDSSVWTTIIGMTFVAMGVAPIGPICTERVITAVPPDRTGAAVSLSETSGEFGIAMGVAVIGSASAAVYRTTIDGTVPADTPEAVALRVNEDLPSAVEAIARFDSQGWAVDALAAAREAFVAGFTTVAGISAVLLIALALITPRMLR